MGAVCEKAKKIIVEVNTNMPRLPGRHGELRAHFPSERASWRASNPPIGQMAAAGPASEVDLKVANLVVPQIPNGACLQLGIGGMPNAIGSLIAQSDLKDLGVHTEMYVDAFVDIAKAGKITGCQQAAGQGPSGLRLRCRHPEAVRLPRTTTPSAWPPPWITPTMSAASPALDNFISINNAVDIDLFGQVNAESAGIKHISRRRRPAGLRAGCLPFQGRQELHLPVLHLHGQEDGNAGEPHPSPPWTNGSIVTDTRCQRPLSRAPSTACVNLKGLTSWEKAEALISVAHPDFREQLIAEADKMHIWRRSNKR